MDARGVSLRIREHQRMPRWNEARYTFLPHVRGFPAKSTRFESSIFLPRPISFASHSPDFHKFILLSQTHETLKNQAPRNNFFGFDDLERRWAESGILTKIPKLFSPTKCFLPLLSKENNIKSSRPAELAWNSLCTHMIATQRANEAGEKQREKKKQDYRREMDEWKERECRKSRNKRKKGRSRKREKRDRTNRGRDEEERSECVEEGKRSQGENSKPRKLGRGCKTESPLGGSAVYTFDVINQFSRVSPPRSQFSATIRQERLAHPLHSMHIVLFFFSSTTHSYITLCIPI